MEINWLTKLLLSHLLADFVLQPSKWVTDKNDKHYRSGYLYLHTFIAAALAWVFMGWAYWKTAMIIFITHTLIDIWKSYRRPEIKYFLIDQLLHLLVIVLCWYFNFFDLNTIISKWNYITASNHLWITGTAFVFVAWPSAILIGQLTKKWRNKLPDADALGDAGKWIGIIERILILIFILHGQYQAIGLLIAAKSILRFGETGRQEIKTEYLLIGTLISISIAVFTGLLVVYLTAV